MNKLHLDLLVLIIDSLKKDFAYLVKAHYQNQQVIEVNKNTMKAMSQQWLHFERFMSIFEKSPSKSSD